MNAIQSARIIVVAEEACGRTLVDRLLRLGLPNVVLVADLAAARRYCDAGQADACLVELPCALRDDGASLVLKSDAPGRASGTPSLLLADVVTPYVRRAARRAGHVAVVEQNIEPRLMYRRIAGVLQRARRGRSSPKTATTLLARVQQATGAGSPILLRSRIESSTASPPRKLMLQ